MLDVLKFIEVIISILLIFIILIQNKNVSLNLASMSGWMGEVTKRWSEKVLHNATVILWVLFVVNSIALFLLSK
jgi:protein translocase SecG subunit